MKRYFVYILTTKFNKLLYVSITNNLSRRLYEHKNKIIDGYTKKYNVNKLVYFEEFSQVHNAIEAEKKIKGWTRIKKEQRIKSKNPTWKEIIL